MENKEVFCDYCGREVEKGEYKLDVTNYTICVDCEDAMVDEFNGIEDDEKYEAFEIDDVHCSTCDGIAKQSYLGKPICDKCFDYIIDENSAQ